VVAVSISVRLPLLPDARMDTRMPIALSPAAQNIPKIDVEMMAGREPRVNICSSESQTRS